MSQQSTLEYFRYRFERDSRAATEWFRANWQSHRKFRWATRAALAGIVALMVLWAWLARDLPDAEVLLEYETPLPTVVRGVDGEIVHSYARERRVQLQYGDFPKKLIEAYLSAEDKTFFSHGGVDLTGTANAVFDYALKYGSGLNNREIATLTSLSESNVGTILHRIIQKLRTEWEKDYEPTI